MPRGGRREGSGRKQGKPTTKATIYLEDREILNGYAQNLNIPVNELIHRLIQYKDIENIINDIK